MLKHEHLRWVGLVILGPKHENFEKNIKHFKFYFAVNRNSFSLKFRGTLAFTSSSDLDLMLRIFDRSFFHRAAFLAILTV